MAKLVEILARELEEWPDDVTWIAQDNYYGPRLCGFVNKKPMFKDINGSPTPVSCYGNRWTCRVNELAEDYTSSIVTREMWEKQRHLHIGKQEETMEKNIEFKVGDKVKIRKDSKYYGESFSNPADVLGEVEGFFPELEHPIRVEWSTGDLNYYRSCDLELVEDESPAQDGPDKEQPPKVDILAIRDRIYKIDKDLMALQNERAGLVKKLQDEGFILVEKEELDLTDHVNWMEEDGFH